MISLSLLLIEDELLHANMFREMATGASPLLRIKNMDHITRLAELGQVSGQRYDAVLLDLNLPDGTGLGSLATVRAALPDTPIVVLTAYGADEIGVQAIEAGAQDFLQKDTVDRRVLHRTLGYALERHQQTRALLEAQLMQATVLEATSSAIIALDEAGQVLSVNRAAEALLGPWGPQLPCPWPPEIVFHHVENFRPLRSEENPIALARNGIPINSQLYAVSCGGLADVRFVRVSASVLEPRDIAVAIPVALVLSIDDVSAEYRTRQQLERAGRLDALGQLTGGISHDFNNILGAILPSLQLASHKSTEPEVREILEPALSATKRGANLVGQLLSFTPPAPDAGQQVLLADCLGELGKLVNKSADLPVSIDLADADLEVCCIPEQLENAVLNLIVNARDALSESGKGDMIRLSARRLQAGPQMPVMIEIAVEDNGPGMEPAVKARAVDPFFSTKPPQHGSGLGLPMVYGFVKAAGGTFDLSSEPGVGTTVRMILPLSEGTGSLKDSLAQELDWIAGDGRRVLLVEDEADLRLITATTLTALDFEVTMARSGEEALEVLAEIPQGVDILFTDIVLPGEINGFGLAHQACALHPDLRVVYTSGYTGITDARTPPIPGPFLPKPCDIQDISNVLRALLSPGAP